MNISIEDLFLTNQNKYITCCFTGHRPHKLGISPDTSSKNYNDLTGRLKAEIIDAINHGYKIFICGGSIGVDMYAAKIIIELRRKYPYISLELALPCYNHDVKWNREQRLEFTDIKKTADKIIYVNESDYFEGCMEKRNKYMIDRSSLLISVFNGSPGGTKQTVEYAKKNFINIINLTT